MTEARKEARRGPRAANLIGTVTEAKEALGNKGKGKGKSETRYCDDCGKQGLFGANCPDTWTNKIDEGSFWESEQAFGGLNHLVSRNAGGAHWTWKKVTIVVDSGAAESVMPRSTPEISTEEAERSKNGKGFKRPEGVHIKNYGQQVMSVRTLEGFVRKSTWQVADARRPFVSASHIIQAGNDLFIGNDKAYIMNRKKKKESAFRKEGNVYVLDLFVKVP